MDCQIIKGASTPLFFQRTLAEEIKNITKDMLFQDPSGGDPKALQVFAQALPVPSKTEGDCQDEEQSISFYGGKNYEEDVFNFPWCLVKIDNGQITEANGHQSIDVAIGFGIFNNSLDNNGHEELLNLIQRVYERFARDPILARQYTCNGKFEWALQDEDTFPHFFGAIATTFTFLGIRREMKF